MFPPIVLTLNHDRVAFLPMHCRIRRILLHRVEKENINEPTANRNTTARTKAGPYEAN